MVTALATTPRALPYSAKRFDAFKVAGGKTYALDAGATSLEDAVKAAQFRCFHKQHLVIRETDDETGDVTLHLFVIRKAAPKWVHPAGEIVPRRVEDLYAEAVCVVDGGMLL